ncbi:MAG TPA: hypothetical protein VMP08_13160, partial [Anaerolineae bacterium]|nr:hypothetical protein [Anaerolineae bacterium]
ITTPLIQETLITPGVQPEKTNNDQPSLREALSASKQSQVEQRTEPIVSKADTYSAPVPEESNVSLTSRAAQPIIAVLNDLPVLPDVSSLPLIVETEFGGACYFINLGLFLNLYSDFTTPLQPGLDLPIWDFMALVAQELLGEEVTRDPIWSLLAQLADRAEDEPPGAHFDPTRHIIASHAAAQQSPTPTAEIASSHPSTSLRSAQDAPHNDISMEVWLADLMSIIRPRLQLALGVSANELPHYFKQHARIVVSAMTFDVYFALADLPIEIRLSGLDRDPGWVPAAGRTVRFHYD